MLKKIICTGAICPMVLFMYFHASCQVAPAAGARSASMAGLSAGLEDCWAILNNPACLARYSQISLATSLCQKFLMKETGQYALCGTLPVTKGCFGFSALFSGYGNFVNQSIITGFGKIFGENVLAGINLVYNYQKAGDYAHPLHQVSYSIGTVVLLPGKSSVSFTTFNPFQLYFKNEAYATLPSVFKIGFSYGFSQELTIHTELEKDLDYPVQYKLGFEYSFRKIFIARAGFNGFPASFAFGAGIRQKHLQIDIASSYHIYLGFSPAITLQYDLK